MQPKWVIAGKSDDRFCSIGFLLYFILLNYLRILLSVLLLFHLFTFFLLFFLSPWSFFFFLLLLIIIIDIIINITIFFLLPSPPPPVFCSTLVETRKQLLSSQNPMYLPTIFSSLFIFDDSIMFLDLNFRESVSFFHFMFTSLTTINNRIGK